MNGPTVEFLDNLINATKLGKLDWVKSHSEFVSADDGDYVKMIEPKMIDGVIGNYRVIPIRVIDAPPSFDKDQIVVREKKSFKVLYTTEGEGKE